MANRLQTCLSPYLQQHADNPVNWYPWGPEALEAARREDKPIFLSIGYSACHWCHVMEQESFSDEQIAQILNTEFIPVKVDREERPDIDQTYVEAVQLLVGHAGWPLSVFLTPDLEPFYGGTYWPRYPRGGLPGFEDVLAAVAAAWKNRRAEVQQIARQVREVLQQVGNTKRSGALPGGSLLPQLCRLLAASFDSVWGGFGEAPKFPRALELRALLREWARSRDISARSMVEKTLRAMACGGIYDQLGGGFHRYSVDAAWRVPHFEKMLYDNAMLLVTYLEAWQAWQSPEYRRTIEETVDYLLRDLRLPGGAFASSEDADSEGKEGAFYLWSKEEIVEVLGPERAGIFLSAFTSPQATVEGRFVLHRAAAGGKLAALGGGSQPEVEKLLDTMRQELLEARQRRPRPFRDDKVITAWNALAIEGLARTGAAFGRADYLEAACQAADFLHRFLWHGNRLYHYCREGKLGCPALLDDYAALICALIHLVGATGRWAYLHWARELAEQMIELFADPEGGGFFFTPHDLDPVLVRRRDLFDSPTPSGNGLAAWGLLSLGILLGRSDYLKHAEDNLRALLGLFSVAPTGVVQGIVAHELWLSGPTQLILVGPPEHPDVMAVRRRLYSGFFPDALILFLPMEEREAKPGEELTGGWLRELASDAASRSGNQKPILYVCRGHTCQAPAVGREAVAETLAMLDASQGQGTFAVS